MSSKHIIMLCPVEMTRDLMIDLERRNLVIRLAPRLHTVNTPPGTTDVNTIYASEEKHGPHKLIVVSVNRTSLSAFATHPAHEEFLLIGEEDAKPLILVVALCLEMELRQKVAEHRLSAEDFVALRVKYNDPEVSFFTMRSGVPHGEAVLDGDGKPAKFYVTEPRDLTVDLFDLGSYELSIGCRSQ
jgi:hypothetical protein